MVANYPLFSKRVIQAEEAFALIESWLYQPCMTMIHPTERHAGILKDLLLPLGTVGNLTTDAHLAALRLWLL